jgi:hypothetical protein
MDGRFFGPNAEEVGASFHASDGAGGVLAGTLVGIQDASAGNFSSISELTAPTSFNFFESRTNGTYVGGVDLHITNITYTPSSSSYSITLSDVYGTPTITTTLDSSNADGGASDASYDVYNVTLNGDPYVASVLRALPSNPIIVLSYTSILELAGPLSISQRPLDRHYAVFGLPTSQARLPTGTASYSGIAVGLGTDPSNYVYNLNGTASLSVDFGAGTFASTLNLAGTNITPGGGPAGAWTLQFSGTLATNGFFASGFSGHFYGPNAEEFGAAFNVNNAQGSFVGAAVGKR